MYEMTYEPRAVFNALYKYLDPVWLQLGLTEGVDAALEYIQREVQARTPEDRGAARRTILTEIRGSTVDLSGKVFSTDIHTIVLEEGRTPGAKQPPTKALEDWVSRHLGDERLAFVVARAIGRRGLPAHHMFRDVANDPKVIKEVTQIVVDKVVEMVP